MVLQPNTSFGGTQTPGDHFGVSCDECKSAIRGTRHKCNFCPNYDLCSPCRQRGVHNHHMMHELQPYPNQSNFPSQPPTPYPQYPHPAPPPNNPPSYPSYPQTPSQYPQTPSQYPHPQTNYPNAGTYPYPPAYPGQAPQYPSGPSQGGQTPLPPNSSVPTQYPFSPSPYPFSPSPYPHTDLSSTSSNPHTYQQYPSQYPHHQTSSPMIIQASSNSQQLSHSQPPGESVTAAHQTQSQNPAPPIQSFQTTAAASTQSTAASVQSSGSQMTPQSAQTHPAGVTVPGHRTTAGPGPFHFGPRGPMHGSIRGFHPPGRHHGHRRHHPPPPSTQPQFPLNSFLDQNGIQNLMQRMILGDSATVSSNPANQTPPATSNHPTPAPPHAPGGSDGLSTIRWSPAQQGIPSKRIPLQSSDQEHQEVIRRMKASGGDGHVAKVILISRIENHTLFNIYRSCKEEMERENGPGFQNERILWHGTSVDVLDNIYRGGFNRSYCGKNATAYGKGVYFATTFSYSAHNTYSPPDAKGQKYIFQCRVLTGHFAKGQTGLNEPPMRTAELRYDSVVDNTNSPNMFVVFKDMQVYPEYVITLKA